MMSTYGLARERICEINYIEQWTYISSMLLSSFIIFVGAVAVLHVFQMCGQCLKFPSTKGTGSCEPLVLRNRQQRPSAPGFFIRPEGIHRHIGCLGVFRGGCFIWPSSSFILRAYVLCSSVTMMLASFSTLTLLSMCMERMLVYLHVYVWIGIPFSFHKMPHIYSGSTSSYW